MNLGVLLPQHLLLFPVSLILILCPRQQLQNRYWAHVTLENCWYMTFITGSENWAVPARTEERMLLRVTIPKMSLQENTQLFVFFKKAKWMQLNFHNTEMRAPAVHAYTEKTQDKMGGVGSSLSATSAVARLPLLELDQYQCPFYSAWLVVSSPILNVTGLFENAPKVTNSQRKLFNNTPSIRVLGPLTIRTKVDVT